MNSIESKTPMIVFDLGGVLMDWSPYYLYCDKLGIERAVVDQFFKDVNFSSWNKEQDRGRTYAEATSYLISRFPQYSDMIHAYDVQYLETLKGSIQPVVDILSRLKTAGYPLYALSNWSAEKFALVKPNYHFFEWFDGLVISGEVGLVKPDQAIYQYLLERVGRTADKCLFIDDDGPNINAARELGFQTIQFQSAQQLETELRQMGILNGRVNH
jgi:2-haloacid dehalogenase